MERSVDLLLSCLRREEGETKAERLRGRSEEKWREAAAAAEYHGVGPLLFSTVRDLAGTSGIPGDLLEEMRRKYYTAAARNMRLYHELRKVLDLFGRAEIPVILLKGAHLAEAVYGNIALRSMGDVDLLVRREDLSRTEEMLLQAGGEPEEPNRVIVERNCHFAYRMKSGLRLEVHWRLIAPVHACAIDLDAVWSRVRRMRSGKTDALVLSSGDLLIYICAHAAKHASELRLRMLCDVAEILRCFAGELNWPGIRERARGWGLSRAVYVLLRLSRELLSAPIGEDLLALLRPEDFEERWFALARECLLETRRGKSAGTHAAAFLRRAGGPAGKISFIVKRIFLPREEMAMMYPAPADSWRIFLYYPLRLKDLLARHGRPLWRLLRGDAETCGFAEQLDEKFQLRDWLLSK